jgi:polyhydroxyalkanoate synthesis regulator phasin
LSREKKTGAVQEILDKIEKEEKEISDRIKSAVEKVVAEIGLPTQKNIQELRDRLETLEKKISVK